MEERDRVEKTRQREDRGVFPETLRTESGATADPGVVCEQDALWELLEEWKAGEPSAAFDDAVMARIRAEKEAAGGAWWRSFAGWWNPRGFAIAGVAATLILAVVMLQGPEAPEPNPTPLATNAEFSAQQIETALEDLEMLDELYNPRVTDESTQSNKM